MKRAPYVGDAGVLGGGGFPSIPLQTETVAYLSRFSTPASPAYKNALNQAIFKWKAAGVWSQLQDLWLFVADTQADSLRNLVSAARDATITGSPTFTARRGFIGLGASNYISAPFATAGLVAGTCGFGAAGLFNGAGLTNGTVIIGGSSAFDAGCIAGTGAGVRYGGAIAAAMSDTNRAVVAGHVGGAGLSAASVTSTTSAPTTMVASPLKFNNTTMPSVMALGVMAAPTVAHGRAFLGALNAFLDDLGALA